MEIQTDVSHDTSTQSILSALNTKQGNKSPHHDPKGSLLSGTIKGQKGSTTPKNSGTPKGSTTPKKSNTPTAAKDGTKVITFNVSQNPGAKRGLDDGNTSRSFVRNNDQSSIDLTNRSITTRGLKGNSAIDNPFDPREKKASTPRGGIFYLKFLILEKSKSPNQPKIGANEEKMVQER